MISANRNQLQPHITPYSTYISAHFGLDGFISYLNSGEYSDITVIHNGKEYRCHKMILASKSEFFRAMFSNPFREITEGKVELKVMKN